jgi:hypothetical protein
MTKPKSKTSTAGASAHADIGKAADSVTAIRRPKKGRAQAAPATAAAETAPATAAPSAPLAKEKATSGKLSALDAAAKILEETGQAMTCQEMIDAMAKKGYWSSPGGRTPAATLYSAILRELKATGDQGRFVKTERGKFARK